jgi:oligoendopeptidase F
MPVASALPRWDLTPYFPSVESTEFADAVQKLKSNLDSAEADWDRMRVTAGEKPRVEDVETALGALGILAEQSALLANYLECLTTTDSRNEAATSRLSEFDAISVRIQKLHKQFSLWIGALDISAAQSQSDLIREHEYLLSQAKVLSKHLMDPRLESLVTDLSTSGSTAWSRLHSNLTSQIQVEFEGRKHPMTAIRNIAHDRDGARRKSAYEAELSAWKEHELPIAACLNGIKGEVNTLCRGRNWAKPLDQALFYASIDQATLDAMLNAAKRAFPTFRRYLRAKAKALGKSKLPFYDLFAPLDGGTRTWDYDEGCDFVVENFSKYSTRLGDFAARTILENWIDAEPRSGKVGGAYCTGMRGDESRVLLNFDPSFGSVSTLAHELGHAYHNLCLAGRAPLNRETPMTLAETASIFCETIIKNAALNSAGEADRLAILEASLQGQCQVVVDITSRFLFEQSVFDQRTHRELSAREFCELMLQAQRDTYGNGLDETSLHPYMWAVKPHYYSTYSFYNFPYMYGLLFGLGLYSIYERDPDSFRAKYDELLSSTGLADAATLGQRFGIDVRSEEFWAGSLDQIGRDVARFESLV